MNATRFLSAVAALLIVTLALAMPRSAHAEPVMGLESIDQALPWLDTRKQYGQWDPDEYEHMPDRTVAVTSKGRPEIDDGVSLLLSRYRYPAEDEHLDVVVRFDLPLEDTPDGELLVRALDATGEEIEAYTIASIPGSQVFFSYRMPESLIGGEGELLVRWTDNGEQRGEARKPFTIDEPVDVDASGRISLSVINEQGASAANVPMTVGVPFPHGALRSTDQLRLVDESGEEIPLQVKRTSRWSRFGSVRWVLCDFTVDVDGEPRELFLEYGPDVTRQQRDALPAEAQAPGLPEVDAGKVRIDAEGIWFQDRKVIDAAGLHGAFVEHVRGANHVEWGHVFMTDRGQLFEMAPDASWEIEAHGPEKVVLRSEGWYVDQDSGDSFCKYVNRLVVHRDSPVLRLFHTWIFTGDGNDDRIRNMGWRFPLADLEPMGFLTTFNGEDAEPWQEGYYLRQHAHDEFALFEHDVPTPRGRSHPGAFPRRPIEEIDTGERATGVMGAEGDGVRAYLGVQDFWQNFPSSLAFEDGAMTFYQWPKYGRAHQHPIPVEDDGHVWRLRFAHEGEVLSFSLPMTYTTGPIYIAESGPEPHITHGLPEGVNAQGIAKTAEMWLYLTDDQTPREQAVRVMAGLNEQSLRTVVDPVWVARSGAMGVLHHSGDEAYTAYDEAYHRNATTPLRMAERMGLYGKWLYGEVLRRPNLDDQTSPLYRGLRKAHWGWPYSWLPFARSGDPELLRFAEAATRMMTDVAFCHYVGEEVAEYFADLPERRLWWPDQPFRGIGWHNRNMLPWAGYWGPTTRMYVDEVDYLLHAWYLTGYHRAHDVAMTWAEQTKIEQPDKTGRGPISAANNRLRWPANLQTQYVETYQATFDPWFIVAAHALADMNLYLYDDRDWTGHFWNAGHVSLQRYIGDPEHEAFFLHHAEHNVDWHQLGWGSAPSNLIAIYTLAHQITDDDRFMRRIAGILDTTTWGVFEADDPWYYEGLSINTHALFTSWYQRWYPMALGAIEDAGGFPSDPIQLPFSQRIGEDSHIAINKPADEKVLLRVGGEHRITGPDGETFKDGDEAEVTIPADAPEGVYHISLAGRSATLPIAPPDTQEVLVLGDDERMRQGRTWAQHWFYVPENISSFWIEFDNPEFFRQEVRQHAVWRPDGQRAWAHQEHRHEHDADTEVIRAEIEVDPEHAGALWRVTVPGTRTVPFTLDPDLPQVFAHSADRWFAPDDD